MQVHCLQCTCKTKGDSNFYTNIHVMTHVRVDVLTSKY